MKMSRVRFLPRAPGASGSRCLGLPPRSRLLSGHASVVQRADAGTERSGSGRVSRREKGTQMLSDFKKFVLRGNVVDLAVAVVVGVAFTAMVTAFVADLITPLIAAIFGKPDFGNLTFRLHGSKFKYG